MGVGDPQRTTPLFAEVSIAVELLGITHAEYLQLPRTERMKLGIYSIVKNEKHEYEMQKIKDKQEKARQEIEAKESAG
jgi:hypothetical protein